MNDSLVKHNILIVDDNPKNLHLLDNMLTQQGYKIRAAINGTIALQSAAVHTPDLILLDIRLPDINGYGLVKADIVIEAIFEDVEVKRQLFREIEPKLKADALIATNTSSIPLEQLAEALNKPERLVGLHFFNPVAMMPLVEIGAQAPLWRMIEALVASSQCR